MNFYPSVTASRFKVGIANNIVDQLPQTYRFLGWVIQVTLEPGQKKQLINQFVQPVRLLFNPGQLGAGIGGPLPGKFHRYFLPG